MQQKSLKLSLVGTSPLILHNARHLVNPISPLKIEIGKLTSKRKKTEDDHREIARLEWHAGLYLDDKERPFLPGEVLEAALKSAAKLNKLGKKIEQSIFCEDAALEHDGPKKLDALWEDGNFALTVPVRVQAQKVMRTRPIFRKWKTKIEIKYNPDLIDKEDVIETVRNAGRITGLCDWRPRYGRFEIE